MFWFFWFFLNDFFSLNGAFHGTFHRIYVKYIENLI